MKMTKYVSLIALVSVLSACTGGSLNPLSQAPGTAKKDEAISNEFNFVGDKAAVESKMSQMGLRAHIQPISKSLNMYGVTYFGKKSYAQVANALEGSVELIEQNSTVSLHAVEKKYDWPEDKYFFYQWAFNNFGQSAPWGLPGKYDADIKLLQALQKYGSNLSADTTVAVIDTGVNAKHEDLNANMWVNEKEAKKSGGIAGSDDDENGYCDDVYGYDFVSEDRMAPHCGQMGDEDPEDTHGHGTHCAGNIAAVANNGKGVSGVNPRAKIMALRAFGNNGGNNRDIMRAIVYAMENGANVISASYGGGTPSEMTKRLIEKAGEKGILFVAAAGNDGRSLEIEGNKAYPGSYDLDNIITVSASDNMDNVASFSNYGHTVSDVFAPGVAILSTYKNGGYTIMSGTSMATPIVSGLASLLMSAYPELKKNPVRVKEIIMATVDRAPAMYGKVVSNGRINALKALDAAQGAVEQTPMAWNEEAYSVTQLGYNTELVDIRHTIEKEGAKAIRAHFNFMDVDRQFDSIYIYDENYKLVSELENGISDDLWTPVVQGSKMIVRFVNAKVRKTSSSSNVKMSNDEQTKCLDAGGEVNGPVLSLDPTVPSDSFNCLMDNMEYQYDDLRKDINDEDVYYSWQSQGFTIDKIQYTETSI